MWGVLVYVILFSWLIYRSRFFSENGIPGWVILVLWSVKILAGFSVLWIYQHYYSGNRQTGDVFKYFDDAQVLYRSFSTGHYADFFSMLTGWHASSSELMRYYADTDFWFKRFNYGLFNENRMIIRVNLLIRLFSGGHIFVHSLFFSFFSFTGLWALYKAILSFFESSKKIILLLVIFGIPSLLFWSSSIMKETLVLAEFGWVIYFLMKLKYSEKHIKWGLLFLLAFVVLLFTKIYVALALLPGMIVFLWYQKQDSRIFVKMIIVHGAFFLLMVLSSFTAYDIVDIVAQKQHDFINMITQLAPAKSAFEMEYIEPSVVAFIIHTPQAMFNSLMRPLPNEVHNVVSLMAFLENVLFWLFGIVVILFHRRRQQHTPIETMLWSFSIILLLLIGLTTPVTGAIVRYRIPAILSMAVLLVYYLDIERVLQKIYRLFFFQKIDR